MALAEVKDVKRILGIDVSDASKNDAIEETLKGVEEYVRSTWGGDWDVTGTVTETFEDVRQDETFRLKDPAPTSLVVTAFGDAADSTGTVLTVDVGYLDLGSGDYRLIFNNVANPIGLEGARMRLIPGQMERLQVAYTASGSVPNGVREGTAIIAATTFTQQEQETSGLQTERLGDYSYSLAVNPQTGRRIFIPRAAEMMLDTHARSPRAMAL